MSETIQVTRLRTDQLTEASVILGRAFHEDAMFTCILPDAEKRRRAFPPFTRKALRYGDLYGEVYTTSPQPQGIAMWLAPGKAKFTTLGMLRVGMFTAPFNIGFSEFGRLMTLANHMEHLQARDVSPQHWHLMILGVDPDSQGQGIGSALIQPGLDQADRDGLPSYLETVNPRNLDFYGKHGFEVLVHDHAPKGGPEFWTMLRKPKPKPKSES